MGTDSDLCPNCGAGGYVKWTSCIHCTWEKGEDHFMPDWWGPRNRKNVTLEERQADWEFGRTHNWVKPGDIKKKKPRKTRSK